MCRSLVKQIQFCGGYTKVVVVKGVSYVIQVSYIDYVGQCPGPSYGVVIDHYPYFNTLFYWELSISKHK